MKNTVLLLGKVGPFLNQHWFKIGLGLLVLYTVLSRDLSFRVSVHDPGEAPEQVSPPAQGTASQGRETLTEHQAQAQQTTNLFDFWPSWGESEAMLLEGLQQVPITTIESFVSRFAHVAQAEAEKFGIPAGIILAQGLLQSQGGTASWAAEGHNLFALACSDDWTAGTQDGRRGCLRGYDNAWMSFRDHSLYLRNGPHRKLRRLRSSSYREWAAALADTFADGQADYDQQLLTVVERFNLVQYDRE